ncbi:hypothetical protein [Catellatospora vulcania]|uniref:hypothetical protein n=1 Tax=Catellatospora vulcania TaxID=1460450 RepID=UPI0012D406DB|nr:hypothetical protein [Catellatospora vulcania]
MKHQKSTNRTGVLVAVAALGTVGVATAAWAVFGSTVIAGASGGAETVTAITVSGQQLSSPLLPNEASHVQLTIANPNANVRAQVTSITPGAVAIGGVAQADVDTCKAFVVTTQGQLPGLPTLEKNGSTDLTIVDGVKLGNAPMKCQGMTWTTYWDVTFQAVR